MFGIALVQDVSQGGNALAHHGLTVAGAAAIYLGGGTLGGSVVGLLLPLAKWRVGAGVLGDVGLLPVIGGIAIAIDGLPRGGDSLQLAAVLLVAFGVGGTIGIANWRWLLEYFDTRPPGGR